MNWIETRPGDYYNLDLIRRVQEQRAEKTGELVVHIYYVKDAGEMPNTRSLHGAEANEFLAAFRRKGGFELRETSRRVA